EDVVKNFKTESPEIKTVAEISSIQKSREIKPSISNNKKVNDVSNNNNTGTKGILRTQNVNTNQKPAVNINQTQQNTSAVSNKNSETKIKPITQTQVPEQKKEIVKPVIKETDQAIISKPEQKQVNNAISINKPAAQKKDVIETVRELPAIAASRKNQTIQDIYFKNDSLVLSLYDNGIVDGDTVSVFLNGETIISKQ